MIKTLRITSIIAIIAAILATVFFVFPAVFGVGGDEEIEQFLRSAGAIEKFKLSKAKGDKVKGSESRIPPLVKQAKAFALYLNPPPKPPKPRRTPTTRKRSTTAPRPPKVSAKFNLIGTVYYPSRPELSLALIDKPGKGLRWVRQSGKVGHLVIEQVKDGLVVVKDGKRTFEEPVANRPEKTSLIKTKGSSPHRTDSKSTVMALGKKGPGKEADGGIPGGRTPQSVVEEISLVEKFLDKIRTMQKGSKTDKTGSGHIAEENAALMEKYISDLEAMRIGAEEARKLDDLGRKLKGVRQDTNRAKLRGDKIETSSSEPNSPEKK